MFYTPPFILSEQTGGLKLLTICMYVSVTILFGLLIYFKFRLTPYEILKFEEFQKNRLPSMRVVGRGTLTMSLEDARKSAIISRSKNNGDNND